MSFPIIHAEEAAKMAQDANEARREAILRKYDKRIREAASDGHFAISLALPLLGPSPKAELGCDETELSRLGIIKYLSDLGYTTKVLSPTTKTRLLQISWEHAILATTPT